MDYTLLAQFGVSGGTLVVLGVLWRAFLWVNHRRITSHCCGKVLEMELDVDSPPVPVVVLKPPPVVKDEHNSPTLQVEGGRGRGSAPT